MAAPQKGYPLAVVTDFIIGYLKEVVFNNTETVPAAWEYVAGNQRTSRIRISGPFVIDSQKPLSQPFVVIERGEFSFRDRVVNDTKSADPNTLCNEERVLMPSGVVLITCGSGSSSEASSLANFIIMIINSARNQMYSASKFIRKIRCVTLGPEIPAYKGHKIQRYETTLVLDVGLQFGFQYAEDDPVVFSKFSVRAVKKPYELNSNTGVVVESSPIFTDLGVKFGTDVLFYNNDLQDNWYQLKLKNNPEQQLIIDSINLEPGQDYGYSLNLKKREVGGSFVPWNPSSSDVGVEYSITWNNVHLFFNYPGDQVQP